MSCGTCGVGSTQNAAARIEAPAATGAAINTPGARTASDVTRQIRVHTSQASRRRMWQHARTCPQCGARASFGGDETCPLCGDTGAITWDDQTLAPSQLQARVVEQAQRGQPSGDGYLWIASHVPGLMQDDAVRKMIRAEAALHPAWALWGHAPDALVQAGLRDVVQDAARAMPDAAKASLRALKALVQAQGEVQ